MIEATLILSLPIMLSWFASVQKRHLRGQTLRRSEEVQALESELNELMDTVRRRDNADRYYIGKRDALQADIDVCRAELQELKQSPRKMAA